MGYILPRAFVVLIGWAITCGLIKSWWTGTEPTLFYVAGASWVLAGVLCFGYLHRLRREAEDQRGRF